MNTKFINYLNLTTFYKILIWNKMGFEFNKNNLHLVSKKLLDLGFSLLAGINAFKINKYV